MEAKVLLVSFHDHRSQHIICIWNIQCYKLMLPQLKKKKNFYFVQTQNHMQKLPSTVSEHLTKIKKPI